LDDPWRQCPTGKGVSRTLSQIRLRKEVLEWRQVDDEIVALDLNASKYLSINPTGAAIWPLLSEGASPTDLVDRLVETFDVDQGTAQRDVETFIGELSDRDLLERV
jgi:hypothetical protein